MKQFFTIVLASVVFISCQDSSAGRATNNNTNPEAGSVTPATQSNPVVTTNDSNKAQTIPAGNVTLQQSNLPTANVPSTSNPSTNIPASKNSSVALNPAHGQPGHRCEIPVGSPLNTPAPAAAAPSQVQATQSPVLNTPVSQPAVPKGARLNPPHGQPGHDCAVQVGQPLKN